MANPKHLATYGLFGYSGRRIGTRYIYKPEEITEAMTHRAFRWRNDACWDEWLRWHQQQEFSHAD